MGEELQHILLSTGEKKKIKKFNASSCTVAQTLEMKCVIHKFLLPLKKITVGNNFLATYLHSIHLFLQQIKTHNLMEKTGAHLH